MSGLAELEVRVAEVDTELKRMGALRRELLTASNDLLDERRRLTRKIRVYHLTPRRWWQLPCRGQFVHLVRCGRARGHTDKHYNSDENVIWS